LIACNPVPKKCSRLTVAVQPAKSHSIRTKSSIIDKEKEKLKQLVNKKREERKEEEKKRVVTDCTEISINKFLSFSIAHDRVFCTKGKSEGNIC